MSVVYFDRPTRIISGLYKFYLNKNSGQLSLAQTESKRRGTYVTLAAGCMHAASSICTCQVPNIERVACQSNEKTGMASSEH